MESDVNIGIRVQESMAETKPTQGPSYSETYLDDQMRKAEPAWVSVPDPDVWLEELRGGGVQFQGVI